ncbi:2-dehydro-3-deoxy-6-phosphogalactonate aldolase [Microbulbifer agarilyticus]
MQSLNAEIPLIAILRGITPEEIIPIAEALVDEGFRAIEVPLNSPNALASIRTLQSTFGDVALCGAGTVTSLHEVDAVAETGAQLVVTPNTNPQIIEDACERGMTVYPGALTPTEVLSAIRAGAHGVKLFPAGSMGPDYLKNLSAVLPKGYPVFAVGGITTREMASFWQAGARGFGIGGDLYRPGDSTANVRKAAQAYVSEMQQILTT